MNSTKVWCVASVLSALVRDCASVLVCVSNAKTLVALLCIFSALAITKTAGSSCSGVLSVPSVRRREKAFSDRCFTPVQCPTSK